MFDAYGSWLFLTCSLLALVASALVLRSVLLGGEARQGDDKMPARVTVIRGRLAKAMSADRMTQEAKTLSPQALKVAKDSAALAQSIRSLGEELAKWFELTATYRVDPEFDRVKNQLIRLEEDATGNPEKTLSYRQQYATLAERLALIAVSFTDRDFGGSPDVREKLDGCLRRFCAAAEVKLIQPKEGEEFDKAKHDQLGEAHDGGRRGSSQGRPKVTKVLSRGLERAGRRQAGNILAKAEVEVRY